MARTLAFALVLAMAGFCYAVSTAGGRSAGEAAPMPGGRVVGTTSLRFTNPIFLDNPFPNPDVFDLGDAAFGSMTTRYITATGGLRPYSFGQGQLYTLDAQNNLLQATLVFNSTLALTSSGCLMGSVVRGTVSPLVFQVTVGDSFGSQPNSLTGYFMLNLVITPVTVFRFGTDRINNGVVGMSYISKVEALGGYGPVRYTVVPNTLYVNDVAKGTEGALEAIGLSLATDGTIFGRPLEPGSVRFTARAVDSAYPQQRTANDRTNTVMDQVVTFNIEQNNLVSTDCATLFCHVKGDVGQFNKDSITFAGQLNLSGRNFVDIANSRFQLFIGGVSFAGYMDRNGKVVSQRGGPVVYADGSRLQVSVNPRNGQIKGSVKKASLYGSGWKDLRNVADRSTKRVGVALSVANFIIGSDMLEFATRRNGDKFVLDYVIGKVGQAQGGVFQILSVKGADKTTISGQDGVAWSVKFLAIPRYGIDPSPGMDAINTLGIRIGTLFDQQTSSQFLVSTGKAGIQFVKNKYTGEIVNKFAYSPRTFVGSLQSQPLSLYATGIPAAKVATKGTNFTFGLALDRSGTNSDFSGEAARGISASPRTGSWSDLVKAPK
ncbi:MAG: hypothetical protein NTW87_06965 [Planctomycetota bacterium]|nr:hypothetical protein [Planctomycetota bacterium]